MNAALWRRRVFLLVAYAATYFVFMSAMDYSPLSWGEAFSHVLPLRLIGSCFIAFLAVWRDEKPHPVSVLRCAERIETQGHNAFRGDRFHTYLVTARFQSLPHDPMRGCTPINLTQLCIGCMAFVLFLMFYRWFFGASYLLAFDLPIAALLFGLAYSFWISRRISANGDGLTIGALLRKPTFIAWSDITAIEFWKRADGEDDGLKAVVLRGSDVALLLCLKPTWLQKTATQKFLWYLRTATPTASTRVAPHA